MSIGAAVAALAISAVNRRSPVPAITKHVPSAAAEAPVSISFTAAESGEVAGWDAAVVLDGSP